MGNPSVPVGSAVRPATSSRPAPPSPSQSALPELGHRLASSRDSDASGRSWRLLGGARTSLPSRAAELRATHSSLLYFFQEGTSASNCDVDRRPISQAEMRRAPSHHQDARGSQRCRESTSANFGSIPSANQLPVLVPRGVSPFAAASAVGQARLTCDYGSVCVPRGLDSAPAVPRSLQPTRFTQMISTGQEESSATRGSRNAWRNSSNQRAPPRCTSRTAPGQRLQTSEHDQIRRRHVASVVPDGSVLERRSDRPSSRRRGVNDDSQASAVHGRTDLFHPTWGPAEANSVRSFVARDEGSRSSNSQPRSTRRLTFFEGLVGESLVARIHRALATNVRALFSPSFPPSSRSERPRGQGEPFVRGVVSSPPEFDTVFGGPGAIFMIYGTAMSGRRISEVIEGDLGRVMEELESMFSRGDSVDYNPYFVRTVTVSDPVSADNDHMELWGEADELPAPIRQICEARSLLNNLERHAIKWTYRDSTADGSISVDACPSAVFQNSASSRREVGRENVGGSSAAGVDGVAASPWSCVQQSQAESGKTQNGKECCICLSAFEPGDSLFTLRCLHIFHAGCLDKWIKTSHNVKCPLCKTKIAEDAS